MNSNIASEAWIDGIDDLFILNTHMFVKVGKCNTFLLVRDDEDCVTK